MPLFLTNQSFRNNLIRNVKHNNRVAYFWREEFEKKSSILDRERLIGPALSRIDALLGHLYVRDIVGQAKTTVDFSSLIDNQRIIFLKIPASLPADVKRFIGTIIVSELLHAIRKRDKIPEKKRQQFCLYVDEFQHFATDDFAIIINEGRKSGAACTISHQERFGQLRDRPSVLGATLATANKIFFQMTVKDAKETAPEFAKPPPTEIRLERPVLSPK